MIDRLKAWYHARKPETKAAIRTAGQSAAAVTFIFVVTAMNEANDIVNGQPPSEALADLSVAAKLWTGGIIAAATGFVSWARNHWFSNPAQYES